MTQSRAKPPSPEHALRKVRRFSRLNGWSVTIVAGLAMLVAMMLGDLVGQGVGLLATVCGLMEVHGQRRLSRRDAEGMRWLVRSQVFLLGVILVYAVSRLASFDADTAMGNLTPEMATALREAGMDPAELLPLVRLTFYGFYSVVIVVTVLYQGGLALYYRSRGSLVAAALAANPVRLGERDRGRYAQVAIEMEAGQLQPGLWARAQAECGGDVVRCQASYIRLRVAELRAAGGGEPPAIAPPTGQGR